MDLSFSEVIVVCVIAFLIFGPEDFIRKVNKFGLWLGKMKTSANNFKIMLENEVHEKDRIINENVDSKNEIRLEDSNKDIKNEQN